MAAKNTIFVSYILDESGSMETIRSSVISGFNEYLGSLKRETKVKYKFSLTKFDTNGIRKPYMAVDVDKVNDLDMDTYTPGAGTPLYDAVCDTIVDLEKNVKDKESVIVAIMTDGLENSSHEHSQATLQALIKRLSTTGYWTFVFLGANQDSWALAQQWGIPKGNVANWKATPAGTTVAFAIMANSNIDFALRNATKGMASTTEYFSNSNNPPDET
jgi:hypothetical protein